MELPISSETYAMSSAAMVRAASHARVMRLRAASEAVELDCGGVLYVREDGASLGCAAVDVPVDAARGDVEAVCSDVAAAASVIDAVCEARGVTCASIDIAESDAWSDELAQRCATVGGYTLRMVQVHRLAAHRPKASAADALQIVPARAVYAQLRALHERAYRNAAAEGGGQLSEREAGALAACRIDMLDEPRLDAFCAMSAGRAIGVAAIASQGQAGVIDHLIVDPEVRADADAGEAKDGAGGGAVARGLVESVIEHAMRAMFEQVLVACERDGGEEGVGDAAVYVDAGFAPAASYLRFLRPGAAVGDHLYRS